MISSPPQAHNARTTQITNPRTHTHTFNIFIRDICGCFQNIYCFSNEETFKSHMVFYFFILRSHYVSAYHLHKHDGVFSVRRQSTRTRFTNSIRSQLMFSVHGKRSITRATTDTRIPRIIRNKTKYAENAHENVFNMFHHHTIKRN